MSALADAIRDVQAILGRLEAARDAAPSIFEDYDGHRRAAADMKAVALAALDAIGAKVRDRYDGVTIRHCGISSSSTSGLPGALQNWLRAARRREAAS